jgi:hypothetical protein
VSAAIVCCLLSPAPALAGTGSVNQGRLTVSSASGEANDLLFTQDGGDDGDNSIRVRESGPGSVLSAGPGCQLVGANEVRCGSVYAITVNVGGGNDKVVNQAWAPSTLAGGPGDDQLYGGAGADSIDGQEDSDVVSGGFGDDDMSGGPGTDTVTYSYAWYPIVADPDGVADDGLGDGGDNVRPDVENLTGGRGSDTLTGGSGPNVLDGAEGNDTLNGRDGDDALVGGSGRDTLSGEAGADSLHTLDGAVDSSSCGSGRDSVIADPADSLAADCETSTLTTTIAPPLTGPAPRPPVRITRKPVRVDRGGRARLRLRCVRPAAELCSGKVTLELPEPRARKAATRRSRRVLGSARFRARRGRLATVEVRLSRNGRRRVLRSRRIRCRASVAVRQANGATVTVRGTVTLVVPEVKGP